MAMRCKFLHWHDLRLAHCVEGQVTWPCSHGRLAAHGAGNGKGCFCSRRRKMPQHVLRVQGSASCRALSESCDQCYVTSLSTQALAHCL